MNAALRQATGVAISGRALLIEGPPGSGKSSLALALIDRGAVLIGDDGVALRSRDGALWAGPPPNIRGLLEIRNVGLVAFPVTEAPIGLIVRIDPDAPRLPAETARITLLGHAIPALALHPAGAILPLRAERALELHGLATLPPFHLAGESPDRG